LTHKHCFTRISNPEHWSCDISNSTNKPCWGCGADGYAIGVIGVKTNFPLIVGNIVNVKTFPFPVYVKVLEHIDGSDILTYREEYVEAIIDAANDLVSIGARAVVGACGSFANYQTAISDQVAVPTFMSVMLQVPLVMMGLRSDQTIGVLAFDKAAVTSHVFAECGISEPERLRIYSTDAMEQSIKLRAGDPTFSNEQFGDDLAEMSINIVEDDPDVGAIVIQCSELPPYAWKIQRATGLPVFDVNSLVTWAHQAAERQVYAG